MRIMGPKFHCDSIDARLWPPHPKFHIQLKAIPKWCHLMISMTKIDRPPRPYTRIHTHSRSIHISGTTGSKAPIDGAAFVACLAQHTCHELMLGTVTR